jgi:hypothetical protein
LKTKAVVLLVLSLAALLNWAIPPFQNPDEPLHLAAIMRFARGEEANGAVQEDILRFMDRHNWWRLIGMRTPPALPSRLEEIPFLVGYYGVEDYLVLFKGNVLYHFAAGKLLAPFAGGSVVRMYYLVRFFSWLFFGAALWLVYRALEKALGKKLAASGFLFVLFLPQLNINSLAASPDGLTLFLGSAFFYAAFSLFGREGGGADGRRRGQARWFHFVLLFIAPALAILVDKSVAVLVLLCPLVLVFFMTRRNYQDVIVLMLLLAIVFILSVYFLVLAFPLQMESGFVFFKSNLRNASAAFKSFFNLDPFSRKFLGRVLDSFYLRFGWLAFGPGRIVDWIWRIAVFGACAGAAIWWIRFLVGKIKPRLKAFDRELKEERGQGDLGAAKGEDEGGGVRTESRVLLFSSLAVLVQVFAVRVVASPHNTYAQGRYLFPYVIPIAVIFVLGIQSLFDLFARKGAAALRVVLVLMFLYFNYVLWGLVIPVFHLTVKSPYPGI